MKTKCDNDCRLCMVVNEKCDDGTIYVVLDRYRGKTIDEDMFEGGDWDE